MISEKVSGASAFAVEASATTLLPIASIILVPFMMPVRIPAAQITDATGAPLPEGTFVSRRGETAPPEADRSPTYQASVGGAGTIEIALPNGVRICVAGLVSEKALSRVLRAMRGTL